jgi:hypothetical protein
MHFKNHFSKGGMAFGVKGLYVLFRNFSSEIWRSEYMGGAWFFLVYLTPPDKEKIPDLYVHSTLLKEASVRTSTCDAKGIRATLFTA